MKKVLSILALALLTLGFASCEADTNVQDTEALFQALDQNATDGTSSDVEERDPRVDKGN